MYIADYSQIVCLLYHAIWKKNDLKWGPENKKLLNKLNSRLFMLLGQSEKDKMWKIFSTWQPGRMVLPECLAKKRLKDDCWGSGVGDTKALWPASPQLKKRCWQLMKGWSCFRSDWHWSTASSDTLTASAGLDVFKGKDPCTYATDVT